MEFSFSHQLRQEYLSGLGFRENRRRVAFYTCVLASFRFRGKEMRFSTRNEPFAHFLCESLRAYYHVDVPIKHTKNQTNLLLNSLQVTRKIRADMEQFAANGLENYTTASGTEEQGEMIAAGLAALFLSCGSIADPSDSYHLEFSLQRQVAVQFFTDLFRYISLDLSEIKHQGYFVLYAKDGQTISDFLLYSKAHRALLQFEAVRVEKDMLNQVNRVVNCDSANADRVADSSARQRYAIRKIMAHNRFHDLSEGLKEAALVRMENPELSLSELGELMQPPLGKSGMSHRLRKLMKIAEDLPVKEISEGEQEP